MCYNGSMNKQSLPIQISAEERDKLEALAIAWGVSLSGAVRRLIRECPIEVKVDKTDHEVVSEAFAEVGYELLGEYEHSKTPIKFRCDKGHEHTMSWWAFKQGHRCGACASKRVTTEEVKAAFSSIGCEMLGEYVNNSTPIKFRCDKGHEYQITWAKFRQGQRCGICAASRARSR